MPKAAMLIGDGVSSYEAGEVWHLLDTRIHMPITKIQMRSFRGASLDKYTTLVMVSGGYPQLDSIQQKKLKDWVSKGNTLITIAGASRWLISKKLVKESKKGDVVFCHYSGHGGRLPDDNGDEEDGLDEL